MSYTDPVTFPIELTNYGQNYLTSAVPDSALVSYGADKKLTLQAEIEACQDYCGLGEIQKVQEQDTRAASRNL